MTVLDASAVLAFLQGQPGADAVADRMGGAAIGAANLSEVLSRFTGGTEVGLVSALLTAKGVRVEPVLRSDAQTAARIRHELPHLALGDRLCLALAERLDADVLTADRAWGSDGRVVQIRP